MNLLAILATLGAFSVPFFILGYAFDAKFDWTKERELLLWFTTNENGVKTRQFIKIF